MDKSEEHYCGLLITKRNCSFFKMYVSWHCSFKIGKGKVKSVPIIIGQAEGPSGSLSPVCAA